MKKSILLCLILLCMSVLFSEENIQRVKLSDFELFECTDSDFFSTNIVFNLDTYNKEMINIDGVDYTRITYSGEGESFYVGEPEIPKFTRYITIPDDGALSLEFSITSQHEIRDVILFPRQSDEENQQKTVSEFSLKEEFYQRDNSDFENLVELGEPAYIRNVRVVPITVNAFQYNALGEKLTICDKIEITVSSSGRSVNSNLKVSRFFEPVYKAMILNYDDTFSRTVQYQKPSYLVVYPDTDSDTFMQYMEDFLEWKHQKGFEVNSVSVAETGGGIDSIRNYVRNAYNTWENPPEFLCILGDAGGNFNVPTAYLDGGYYDGEGDYYYSLMDSDDTLADIFVGRISFNNLQEFLTVISKIFHYEKQPYIDSTEWYENVLLVGDPDDSGPSTISTNHFVKQEMQYFNPEFDFTEIYSGNYVQGIESGLNAGSGYFHYRGFANMSGWNINDVANLNNGYMLPFVTHITCVTGDFNGTSDCRSEAFLKYGSPGNPKGAIAAVGTATGNTHTCFNNIVSGGIFSSIFTNGIYQAGSALTNAKYILHQNYPGNPANHTVQFSYWNNLMGDPALELWTGVPQPLNVVYHESISLGANSLEVQVRDASGNPVDNAWVTILKSGTDGDDEFNTKFTDGNGFAYLDISGETVGEADITVTKHDFIPHLGTVQIEQQDVSCQLENYDLDDEAGNDNDLATAGETIQITPTVRNYGSTLANSVTGFISCDNEYIAISETVMNFGSISAGSSSTADSFTSVILGDELPDGEEIVLNLHISDGNDNNWVERIVLTVEGNYVYSNSYTVVDENNQFDPGEEAEFYLTLQNLGRLNIASLNAILTSNDDLISVLDDTATFGEVEPGSQVNNAEDSFEIQINSRVLPGQSFNLNCKLTTNSGYQQNIPVIISVGQLNITDPFGPDAFGYVCYDDGDLNYMESPTYQWLEIDPDLGGSGIELSLSDEGNTGASTVVDIPFEFYFYGEVYDSLTICTNGWVAPGVTENEEFMNWHIPGPIGPSPIIAPFWDDLLVDAGDISYYYSESSGLFVVEWNQVQNESNLDSETFQVILYDLEQHPSTNNNNKILFQYKDIANVDVGSYGGDYVSHGQYATVGIESHNSDYGLEYTYNNSYPAGAKPVQNEMAILFTGLPLQIEQPYLYVNNLLITEDSSYNNQVDNGDDIGFNVELGNVGNNTATSVVGTLTTESPYITINNGVSSYPDIIGGSSEGANSLYQVTVAGNCPDGYSAEFNLAISADGYEWNQIVVLNVSAPEVIWDSSYIVVSPDLMLDPGETADIEITVQNAGGAELLNSNVAIDIDSEFVTLNSINSNLSTIAPGEEGTISINLTASVDVEIQHQIILNWQCIDENGYDSSGDYAIYITQFPVEFAEDFESMDPDWELAESGWSVHNGDFAGSVAPELIFFNQMVEPGEYRAISPVINTLGSNELTLSFHNYVNCSGTIDLCLETSKDGIHWNKVWMPEYSYMIGYQQITVNSPDVGADTFQFAFSVIGESSFQEVWIVDAISLSEVIAEPHNTIYGNINLEGELGDISNALITNGDIIGSVHLDGSYYLSVPTGNHTVRSFLPGYIMEESEEIGFDNVWQSQQLDFDLLMVTPDYAPESLTATGGVDNVLLHWMIPGATGGFDFPAGFNFATGSAVSDRELTGYNIYRDGLPVHFIDDIAVSSYLDQNLLQGSYSYYVTAAYGNEESQPSNIVEVNVQLPPPGSISAFVTPTGEHIHISWTPPEISMPVDNYRLYRNGEAIYTQANYSYLDLNVPPGVYTYAVAAMYGDEESPTIEVTVDNTAGDNPVLPVVTELAGNYPNPFNPNTKIKFSLKEAGMTEVRIYNSKGQKVRTLLHEELEAGFYNLEWNGEDNEGNACGSGIYFYRMRSRDYHKAKKMMLIK